MSGDPSNELTTSVDEDNKWHVVMNKTRKTIEIWDYGTGNVVVPSFGSSDGTRLLGGVLDGKYLPVATARGDILIFDVDRRVSIAEFEEAPG